MADADMRVDRDYLRQIAAPFSDDRVGAVTCLYGGVAVAGTTISNKLAAMFVNDHFAPSVLVAGMLERPAYCFGSTMAVRRQLLEEMGGLAALGTTIADDHRLGTLVRERGLDVAYATAVPGNVFAGESFLSLWRRELRWARTIRSVRPVGSTLSVVTYGLPLAWLAWMMRPRSARRVALLAATAGLRFALHAQARRTFAAGTRGTPELIPLRDGFAFAVWAASRFGRDVRWGKRGFFVD
jgi:ceramide glucosyltransferase